MSLRRFKLGPFNLKATILAATILFCIAPALRPQQSPATETEPAQDRAVFKIDGRLVVLDVAVTDKSGKPVDNLTAADFQVFEDNKEQRILSLEPPAEHKLAPSAGGADKSTVFDPAQPDAFGSSAVDVLVFDQLNTHFADSAFARRSLHDFLAAQPALLAQPTALLTLDDKHFRQIQPFTRDRDLLLRALDATPTKYPWKLEIDGKAEYGPVERLDESLRALEEIAESYAQIPGRKNLFWVGGGFPTINPTTIDGDDALEVKNALQHVTNTLLARRVTLFAVDPSSSAAGMTEITDSSQMAFVQAAGDALSGDFDPFGASDDFNRLGPVTGGRIVRGRNDVARQIAESTELGAHFYTIAYSPSSASDQVARYRKIRVACLRPGLTVTSRSGYYPAGALLEKGFDSTAYDLTTAANSSLPLAGISITVESDTAPDAAPGTYIVRARAANLTWKSNDDGSATASVYIMAVSLDGKKRMMGHTLHGMKANAGPNANLKDPAKMADFLFVAPPPAKTEMLRFVVRDKATGRMGSFDLPLKAIR